MHAGVVGVGDDTVVVGTLSVDVEAVLGVPGMVTSDPRQIGGEGNAEVIHGVHDDDVVVDADVEDGNHLAVSDTWWRDSDEIVTR